MINLKKKRIKVFAPWARMSRLFNGEVHYADKDGRIISDCLEGQTYSNHIETAGFYSSAILSYGCDKSGKLRIMRHTVFPTLRNYPNNTHSSLDYNFKGFIIKVNGKTVTEKVEKFIFDGILRIITHSDQLVITRNLFAARTVKALIEIVEIENTGKDSVSIELINRDRAKLTNAVFGQGGARYLLEGRADNTKAEIKSGNKAIFCLSYCASLEGEKFKVDCISEKKEREAFISFMNKRLIVNTPDSRLNLMVRYAKIRASESIFMTKIGLMHSPGGGGYYAALWTNDQCEYVNLNKIYLSYSMNNT
jgi:hypothetical protein